MLPYIENLLIFSFRSTQGDTQVFIGYPLQVKHITAKKNLIQNSVALTAV